LDDLGGIGNIIDRIDYSPRPLSKRKCKEWVDPIGKIRRDDTIVEAVQGGREGGD